MIFASPSNTILARHCGFPRVTGVEMPWRDSLITSFCVDSRATVLPSRVRQLQVGFESLLFSIVRVVRSRDPHAAMPAWQTEAVASTHKCETLSCLDTSHTSPPQELVLSHQRLVSGRMWIYVGGLICGSVWLLKLGSLNSTRLDKRFWQRLEGRGGLIWRVPA